MRTRKGTVSGWLGVRRGGGSPVTGRPGEGDFLGPDCEGTSRECACVGFYGGLRRPPVPAAESA